MNCSIKDMQNASQLVVRTKVSDKNTLQDNPGSGLLYCYNGKTYLLTAGHCIKDWNTKQFSIEQLCISKEGRAHFKQIIPKKEHFLVFRKEENMDYAILEVENPDNGFLNEARIKLVDPLFDCADNNKLFVYGFPDLQREGFPFDAIYKYPSSWELKVQENPNKNFHDIINGVSGSPILSSKDSSVYSVFAIIKKTLDNSGSLNSVEATPAPFFLNLLNSINAIDKSIKFIKKSINDNRDYIERKVQLSIPSSLDSLISNESLKSTLYEFITGKVNGIQSFRYLLSAPAQSGKSYELRHLAHTLAVEEYNVVFWEGKQLSEEAFKKLPQTESIEGHQTVVIIDAIDEAKIETEILINELRTYCKTYPTIKVLISCRQNFHIEEQLDGFVSLYLSEISFKDACSIIDSRIEDESQRNLLKRYISDPSIKDYTHNIFCLLQLICITLNGGELPNSKAELYQLFVSEGSYTSYSFLQRAALVMMMIGRQSLSLEELKSIYSLEKFDVGLINRSILTPIDAQTYEFVNNAVKEFLVAEYLEDKCIEDVQKLVCFYGTKQIKPQWYNVVMLWLQIKSKRQQLDRNVIAWISGTSKELILNCDINSIGLDTRFLLVQNILEEYKNKKKVFSFFYTNEYFKLYKFAEGIELIEYIAQELKTTKENFVYNVLCLTPYIDYDQLEIKNNSLYLQLVNSLFDIIQRFGNGENCGVCYYFLYDNSHFYTNEDYIERLYSIIKDWKNTDAVNAMAAVCVRGELSDKYVDWLLDRERERRQIRDHIVSQDALYMALGRVCLKKNIGKVFAQITEPNIFRTGYGNEEYLDMLKSLFSTICIKENNPETIAVVRKSYSILFNEHPYSMGPQLFAKILEEFKLFFTQTSDRNSDMLEEIENLVSSGHQSPEQIKEIRLKHQKSFDDMCDYHIFSEKIENVVSQVECFGGDSSLCMIKAGYDVDIYITNFILSSGNIHKIDKDKVLYRIHDQGFYEKFRMCEIAKTILKNYFNVEASTEQVELAKNTAKDILQNEINDINHGNFEVLQCALKLMMRGVVKIDRDVLVSLLPRYANETVECNNLVNDDPLDKQSISLLEYSENVLGKDVLIQSLVYWVQNHDAIGEIQFISIVDYLLKNADQKSLESIFESVLNHSNPAVVELLTEKFIKMPYFCKDMAKRIDYLSENVKMMVLTMLIESEEDIDFARIKLEELFPSLNKFNSQRAIHVLLKAGSEYMLEYTCENKEDIFTSESSYIFNYSNPNCLDLLLKLFAYIYNNEDLLHFGSSSILASIGSIAAQSKDLLDKAEHSMMKLYEQMKHPFLLRQMEHFRTLYYQRQDKQLNIAEAIDILDKI